MAALDRSLVFTLLLEDPEYRKLESRTGSHVITDVLRVAADQGQRDLGVAVRDYLADVRTTTTLAAKADALAAAADRAVMAEATDALLAWTSRRTGTRL